jgi:hypothetical protein
VMVLQHDTPLLPPPPAMLTPRAVTPPLFRSLFLYFVIAWYSSLCGSLEMGI